MTTAEIAKTIRTEIKNKLGHTAKAVSVRTHNYSMGSSIRVVIRTAAAVEDAATIREIAERRQSIRRCEMPGDILSGGNRYVTVDIGREAKAELATPDLVAAVCAARDEAAADPGAIVRVTESISIAERSGDVEIWTTQGEHGTRGRSISGGCSDEVIAAEVALAENAAGC